MYALILAGGKGERLRPLTDNMPKPMVEVAGTPIGCRQVNQLRDAGVTDVVFLVGYLAFSVQRYFGDGQEFGVRIRYSREETPLGRGGALKRGLAMLPDVGEPVIVTNGDVVTDFDVRLLVRDYNVRRVMKPSHAVSILTVPMVSPYGIVDSDAGGRVLQFREKAQLPYSINGGMYVMDPAVRDLLPDLGDHETTTFPDLAQAGRMSALETDRFWRSVDSFKDLHEAESHLAI